MDKRLKLIFIFFLAVILIAVLFFNFKGKEEVVKNDNFKQENIFTYNKDVDSSGWNKYVNESLGFSMKIPSEISCVNRCSKNKSLVPVETIEEGKSVYVVPEYYYDRVGSDGCRKVEYDSELVKEQQKESIKPFLGWKIDVVEAGNLEDVEKFIKENFNESCTIDKDELKDGESGEIKIVGTDWPDVNSACPREMHYKIIYYPESRRLLSVKMGIDYDFYILTDSGMTDYGPEMLRSIDFE